MGSPAFVRPRKGTPVVYVQQRHNPPTMVRPHDDVRTEVLNPHRRVQAGSTATILLVEDEPMVRELFARALRGRGYIVLEAADGAEALTLAAEHAFHLLLTDVVMPRLGGVELVQQLRSVGKAARVIFMTGYAETELVYDSLTIVLQKPFVPTTLAEAVRRLLDTA